jgi:hypothetical protein
VEPEVLVEVLSLKYPVEMVVEQPVLAVTEVFNMVLNTAVRAEAEEVEIIRRAALVFPTHIRLAVAVEQAQQEAVRLLQTGELPVRQISTILVTLK